MSKATRAQKITARNTYIDDQQRVGEEKEGCSLPRKRRCADELSNVETTPFKRVVKHGSHDDEYYAISSGYKPLEAQDPEQILTTDNVEVQGKDTVDTPTLQNVSGLTEDAVVLGRKRSFIDTSTEETTPIKKIIQSKEDNDDKCLPLSSGFKSESNHSNKQNNKKHKTKGASKSRKILRAVRATIKKDTFLMKYDLGEILGQGAFGTVYAATRRQDGMKVAIKIIPKERATRKVKIGKNRSIPAEAYFLNKANHPNIIKLLKFYTFHDCYAIVMETPKECKTLLQYVTSQGDGISDEEIKRILRQLVEAVAYLEDEEILHNDLKTENILVDISNGGSVKIVDFGLSWVLTDEPITGRFVGTYALCPPEYYESHEYFGREANVWSLGCILYDMFTGNVPYAGPSDALFGTLKLPEYIPEGARSLLRMMLEKQPINRASLEDISNHPWLKAKEA